MSKITESSTVTDLDLITRQETGDLQSHAPHLAYLGISKLYNIRELTVKFMFLARLRNKLEYIRKGAFYV